MVVTVNEMASEINEGEKHSDLKNVRLIVQKMDAKKITKKKKRNNQDEGFVDET